MRTRTKFVVAAIINITWYTIAVLVLSAMDKVVPDALTISFFAAWTAELALLAGIKVKERSKDE